MNKAELVDAIVAESGASKNTVAEVLKAFEDVVVGNVSRGEKIVSVGFLVLRARGPQGPHRAQPSDRRGDPGERLEGAQGVHWLDL